MYVHGCNCDTFQIRMFLAAAEERNFTTAAERMHVELPTLSKRISQLEATIGCKLFDRKQKPLQLTDEGTMLYGRWKTLIEDFEDSLNEAALISSRADNKLKIGLMESANAFDNLPRVSANMRSDFPGLSVDYQFTNFSSWPALLKNGDVDVVLTMDFDLPSPDPLFAISEIKRVPKLVCMLKTNPLCEKGVLDYSDLRGQRLIVMNESYSPHMKEYVTRLLRSHGVEPVIGREAPNAYSTVSSLQEDDLILIADSFMRGFNNPLLKNFELPDTYCIMSAVWRKDNPNVFIGPFITHLREIYAGSPRESAALPGQADS